MPQLITVYRNILHTAYLMKYCKPGQSRSIFERNAPTHAPRVQIVGAPFVRLFHGPLSRITAQVCTGLSFMGTLAGSMTQAFGPVRSCAFGARTELIIGTWKGSAAGSLGGEADARPRARPSLAVLISISLGFSLSARPTTAWILSSPYRVSQNKRNPK